MGVPARAIDAFAPRSEGARAITVLVNAHAGGAGAGDVGRRVADAFAGAGGTVGVEVLASGPAIDERARTLARADGVLVAAGGDGTVSAVAAAVAAGGGTLGVLPLGTLNHFAKDLGIPLDLAQAAGVVLRGRVVRVDLGEVNGRIFVNNSSLGLYPRLVWEREQERRRGHRKWLASAIAAARTWRRYRTVVVHLTLDGVERVIATPFVFVGNNEYHASGLSLGGRSTLTAGALSLYVAPACRRFDVIRLIVRALLRGLDGDARFDAWQVQDAWVETSRHRISLAADGELLTMSPPLRYRMRAAALPVLVPLEKGT